MRMSKNERETTLNTDHSLAWPGVKLGEHRCEEWVERRRTNERSKEEESKFLSKGEALIKVPGKCVTSE